MLTEEKLQTLKARIGDDALLEELLSGAATVEKDADAKGVAYKEAETPVEAKADGDMPVDEAAEEDDGELYVGDMTPVEFKALLTESFTEALAPLAGALNVEAKVRGLVDELKTTVGAVAAKKDDEDAQRDERIAQAEATLKAAQDEQVKAAALVAQHDAALKELRGDLPRAVKRASQDESTVIPDDHRLKGVEPQPDPYAPFMAALPGYADAS